VAIIISPKQLSDRAEAYHQLSMLVTSGVPMVNAIEMAQRNAPRSVRRTFEQVGNALRERRTVTEAFHEQAALPEFDAALIEAGDKSGRLDQCFKTLSLYYTNRAQNLRIIINGLLYPGFLFHFAAVLFPFLDYVKTGNGPKFAFEVFGVLIPVYAITAFIIFACQGRHGERWRATVENIVNPIPVIGTARRYLAIARLSTALEALINAGVPIIGGWELAASASGSPFLRRTVSSWKKDLERGSTPSELVIISRAFPEPFPNLYQTGEVTGQLDDALIKLHAYFQEEGSRKLTVASIIFTKIVYGCVAALVAWKVISFYLGLYGPGSELDKAIRGFGPGQQ
jgi:type II secretory pathway component PulF